VLSYYESFHDFPWAVVFPVLLMLAWGGWQWGQRWLSGVIVLLLWIGGYGLLPPHTPGLPRTATVGDLTVTLRSLKRTQRVLFCDFDLTTASGEPLANRCVLNTIQCEGQAFHFLPVPGWRAHEWPREKGQSDREAHLSAWLFPPEWVRSVDLTLKVQTWPSSPACSVSFAVPPHGKAREGEIHAAGEGMKLAVSDVRWSPSWTRGPQEEVLAVRVSYSGYSYSGWTGRELRVTDEAGGALDFGCGSIAGTEGGATLNGEVVAVPRGVRRIVVQAFSEKQLEEGERVYRFTRLPNATRE
jgi:hypothetical protein